MLGLSITANNNNYEPGKEYLVANFLPNSTEHEKFLGEIHKDEFASDSWYVEDEELNIIPVTHFAEIDSVPNDYGLQPPERLYFEGNNGGDFIEVTKINDRFIHLRVASSCVLSIDIDVSVEAMASFLVHLEADSNTSIIDLIKKGMRWDERTNYKFFEGSKQN